jgi:TatD DNase family protein
MIDGLAGRGAYFSFNGSFLAQQRHKKRETFLEIPLDRLLVETDAPAMPPPPELNLYPLPHTPAGETVNHPGNIEVAYEGLATLLGMKVEELKPPVEENFRRLFAKT